MGGKFWMKTSNLVAAACAAFALAGPVAAQAPAAVEPVQGLYANQWDMTSKAGGLAYRIFVAEPLTPPPPGGYPVVYLLDGNGYFGTAVEIARMLELAGEMRPAIIVGVGYPFKLDDPTGSMRQIAARRVFDYTPRPPAGVVVAEMGGLPVGGADDFYRFLKEDLQPRLAGAYRINPAEEVLVGHSLGGLFALDTLFKHPGAYRSVVSASPSIWWGGAVVLNNEAAFKSAVAAGRAAPRVLVTVGGLEQSATAVAPPPGMSQAQFDDYIRRIRTIDNARELSGRLAAVKGADGYKAEFVDFGGETHVSVVSASIARSLRFALPPRP